MGSAVRAVVVGSVNVDLHLRVASHPGPGETVTAQASQRLAGGKGGNQAAALARLGAQVRLHSAVGDDDDGAWSLVQLRGAGVDVGAVDVVPGVPTGRAVVTVDEAGGNRIVVVPGANAHVRPLDEPAGFDVVVLQLEVPVTTVAVTVDRAVRAGVPVVLNAAPAQRLPPGLLAQVDVLVVNEPELAALTSGGVAPDSLASAVVVTLGAAGARVHCDGNVHHVPTPQVTVTDSTGAGDCFVGALAHEVARGRPLVAAAEFACRAAALSVTGAGARGALPTWEEVQAWAIDEPATTRTTTTTRPPV